MGVMSESNIHYCLVLQTLKVINKHILREDDEKGHKSLNPEAGLPDQTREPSRSLEIPEEDRQPKV
jgi:hypothetical protein